MPYYHICSTCGATLDPGEKCDCYSPEALMADVLTLTPDEKRMLLEYNKETKRLDDLYRCAAKQCGISECAFWILYTLRAEERQFTQAEICEFLIEPKQTVHSALKKLEAEGYLARTSGADLRSKRVALTEKGEQFTRAWIDRVPEAEAAALCAMPEAERAAFVRGLHSFCRLLEERLRESKAI